MFTKHGQLKHDGLCLAVKIGRVNEVVRFQPCLEKHPNQVEQNQCSMTFFFSTFDAKQLRLVAVELTTR